MKNPRNKIEWHYWQNPFGDLNLEEFISEDDADEKTPWDIEEKEDMKDIKEIRIRPVMPMPQGFMPVQPFQSFTKAFQFWMGHTNFNITHDVKDKIEETPGVEILDIITRYCFRIAIGKVFNGSEVKRDIERTLHASAPILGELNPRNMNLDDDTEERIKLLQYSIKDKFPYWAIYVLPNGEIDFAGANTPDGFGMHIELYKNCQEIAGGVIYQYS